MVCSGTFPQITCSERYSVAMSFIDSEHLILHIPYCQGWLRSKKRKSEIREYNFQNVFQFIYNKIYVWLSFSCRKFIIKKQEYTLFRLRITLKGEKKQALLDGQLKQQNCNNVTPVIKKK